DLWGLLVRKSTAYDPDDPRQGRSLAEQEQDGMSEADKAGAPVVAVYREKEGTSGYKKDAKRPEFDRAVADLRAGRIATLWVWALDRLSRRGVAILGPLLEQLEGTGRRIIFWDDNLDSS